jgi:hypothetical protein
VELLVVFSVGKELTVSLDYAYFQVRLQVQAFDNKSLGFATSTNVRACASDLCAFMPPSSLANGSDMRDTDQHEDYNTTLLELVPSSVMTSLADCDCPP